MNAPDADPRGDSDERSAAPSPRPGERWVSIYTARSRQDAHLAVAKLQSHDIPARVDGDESAIYGLGMIAGSGAVSPLDAKVHVPESAAAAARQILDEVDRRRVERVNRLPCPRCRQVKPDRVWPKPRLVSIALVVAGFVLVGSGAAPGPGVLLAFAAACGVMWPWTPRWRCTHCGHRWTAPDPDSQVDDEDEDDDKREGEVDDAEEAEADDEGADESGDAVRPRA